MNKPNQNIVSFINKHHVLHLASSFNNTPYCTTCFYMYLEEENIFIFASNENTRHIKEILKNPQVAFSIALETKTLIKIQGVQVTGTIYETDDKKILKKYLKKFPVALFIPFKLWAIQPKFIKMTDNTIGFSHKVIWESNE